MEIEEAMDIMAVVKEINIHLNRLAEIAGALDDTEQRVCLQHEVEQARARTYIGLVSSVVQRFPEFDPELLAQRLLGVPGSPNA